MVKSGVRYCRYIQGLYLGVHQTNRSVLQDIQSTLQRLRGPDSATEQDEQARAARKETPLPRIRST